MAFTFNNIEGVAAALEISYIPKELEKIVAPKPIETRTEISDVLQLRKVLIYALQRSHKELKNKIRIEFKDICRIYFIGIDGQSDFFSLTTVKKKRIAVK